MKKPLTGRYRICQNAALVLWSSIVLCACAGGKKDMPPPASTATQTTIQGSSRLTVDTAESVSVFLDNSVSMNGYLSGNSQFKNVVQQIYAKLYYFASPGNVNVTLLSGTAARLGSPDPMDFSKGLTPTGSSWQHAVSRPNVSPLNDMLRTVLDSVGEKHLGIFISDCIYSLDGNATTLNGLGVQRNGTLSVFLQKHKRLEFNAFVARFVSDFSGSYFDYLNHTTSLKGAKRPYFVWIIGPREMLERYMAGLRLKELDGYQNGMMFCGAPLRTPAWNILLATGSKGRFRPNRTVSHGNLIRGIEDVSSDHGEFGLAFAADLSSTGLDGDYLEDSANYSQSLQTVKIFKFDGARLYPNDRARLRDGSYTHTIFVESNSSAIAAPIRVKLLKRMPSWVESFSTLDDSHPDGTDTRTFALKELLSGVWDAFYTSAEWSDHYVSFEIPVR